MSKKIIITAAVVVFISGTVLSVGLTAFAKHNDKSTKNREEKYDHKFLEQKRIFMLPPAETASSDSTREC